MRATLAPQLSQVLNAGQTVGDVEIETEDPRDGRARHFQASFYPLRRGAASGANDGVGMVVADVTARKRAERESREGEERFRTLVEASAAIIWTADPTGAFARPQANWCRFTGQTAEECLGWGRLACVHPVESGPRWPRRGCAERCWRSSLDAGFPLPGSTRRSPAPGCWPSAA